MTSKAALAFDKSTRSVAALKKFWKDDPVAAATWTVGVVKSAGVDSKALDKLEKLLGAKGTPEAKAAKLVALVEKEPVLLSITSAKAMADAQAAGAATLSWTAAAAEPTRIVGRPVLKDGKVKFETNTGTFDVQMESTWREEIETTFLNEVVTFKGVFAADGKSIRVDQWGPGTEPFFSGRVQIQDGNVYICPTGAVDAEAAKVTNAELKAILLNKGPDSDWVSWDPVGMLLPGEPVKTKAGKLEYRDFPEEGFYVLGRLMKLDVQKLPDGRKVHLLDTGYFRKTAGISPAQLTVPKGSKPGDWPFPQGDFSTGSTEQGLTSPRVFFHAKPLASTTKVKGLDLTGGDPPFTRALEISWVSKPADVGAREQIPFGVPEPTDLNVRVANAAKVTPAGAPKMTAAEATFFPEPAAKRAKKK